MDNKNHEEVKSTAIDNSRLEELMKQEMTPQLREEFLEILKESWLFLPVLFRKRKYDDGEISGEFELYGQFGFDIGYLPGPDGNDMVTIFTSLEVMRQTGLESSTILISMRDLAEMLKQGDEYSTVTLNLSKFIISIDEFLSLFEIVANCRIREIRNDKLRKFLQKREFGEDEFNEFRDNVCSSTFVTAWIDEEDGTNYVPTFDRQDNAYFQLFTDLDEFEKVFEYDIEDIYPQAYGFGELMKFTADDFVINPASESFVLKREMFEIKKD